MAEPVIVPINLEVTDIDMSNINFTDVKKNISAKLTGIRKSIEDAFKGINASAINKPIESAMNSVKKSVQTAEDAQIRYHETLIRAGKSTQEYKNAIGGMHTEMDLIRQRLDMYEARGFTWLPEYKEDKARFEELATLISNVNPLDFVDKASPLQLEKVANALKKVLTATDNVNIQAEKFNQTIKDNKTTDTYQQLVEEAESYKKKLDELNEKSKYMEKYGATDNQWEKARSDADWYSSKLDEVVRKMREAVKTGEALRFGDGSKADLSRQINSLSMSGGNNAGAVKARAMKNESPFTEDYQKALDELDKLEKKVQSIKEKSAKMTELGASKSQFAALAYDAEQLDVKVIAARQNIVDMLAKGEAFKFGDGNVDAEVAKVVEKSNSLKSTLTGVATGAKKAQGGLVALGATHPKLAAVLGTVGKVAGVIVNIGKKAIAVGRTIGSAFSKIGKVLGKVGSFIGKSVSSFFGNKAMNSNNDGIKKLTKNVLMFGFGFRTVYSAVKRLRTTFVEGFKAMGDQFEEFGNPMKEMMSALNRLKASLATAFQPLVSVAMPILTKLMNYLSTMLEAVGKFNAALTGQKYIYKAVAKEINSVSGSAKNANKQLGSYDKLEVIQDNNSEYEYEQVAVGGAEDAASNFAQMVKEAWESANFTGVGQYVTEKLLGILDTVEKNIIPKVTTFANKVLKSINTFVDGFDTTKIGGAVGSIINVFAEGLSWDQLGMAFANINNVVWRFLDGLVNGIDWVLIGDSLSEGIESLVNTLDFDSLAGIWSGLTSGILTAVSRIDWIGIATTLLDGFQTILQEVSTALMSSDNPLISGFGEIIGALNQAITELRPALAAIVNAIGPIVQSFLPIISQLLPPIAELLSQAVIMVMPLLVSLCEAVMPILSQLIEILMPILMDLLVSLQPIFDAVTNVVLPVLVHLLDACMPLVSGLLGLLTDILAPILSLLGPLIEIVFHILDPIISILEPILSILGVLCDVIGAVLRPILDALTPILSAVSSVFAMLSPLIEVLISPLTMVAEVFKFVAGLITGIVVPAIDILMGIIELLCNVVKMIGDAFTVAFSVVKKVIQDGVNVVRGVFNSILSFIESVVNGIIRGVNVMIKALNTLSFNIPDWIPGIGGKKFGFNLSTIKEINIPRLAQGAVIPPNKEFLAMLGDQKSGTNIEAPLDTIKQALAEVLAEVGGGSREPIVLQVSGRTLAKVVWDEQEKRYKQTGKSMA